MGIPARRTRSIVPAALLALLLLPAAHDAYPWGAFRGLAGIKITDTHQQILHAASILFMADPRFAGMNGIPVAHGVVASIDSVLQYEGVDAALTTYKPYGPGPDAEGATVYSCHWFNPLTGRGQAPQAAADWYQRFIKAIIGISGGDEETFKGMAWSAHFLADMFVPYHVIGIPADEALARYRAGNFILSDAEAGPPFLTDPSASLSHNPEGGLLDRGINAVDEWRREGWGVKSNFRETLKIFDASVQASGAGQQVNPLDWFDPWYWNGQPIGLDAMIDFQADRNADPGRSLFSTHASHESWAHGRFVESGGYKNNRRTILPYDELWKNAPPDYAFSGTAWQAQAWQVQDFVAKCALRTRKNLEAYWRTPEYAIRSAAEAVYTLWRSAYTALQPFIQIGRDPARPEDGLVIQAAVKNYAYENCHDAKLRMKVLKGGNVVVQQDQAIAEPLSSIFEGHQAWFVQVNPNEEWTVVVEVVGAFDVTPDLQYGIAYVNYRPDPTQRQARPVEEANIEDFAGTYILGDPQRSASSYNGTVTFAADGTFTSSEFVDGRRMDGRGNWTFDRRALSFSINWPGGGAFQGSVSGNTTDFAIVGHWNNGSAGTLRIYKR
jgi:hypothetical protein